METTPLIIPVAGLAEAAAAAQILAPQPDPFDPFPFPGPTIGMLPPEPITIEP